MSAEEIEQICLKHRGALVLAESHASASSETAQVVFFDTCRFQIYHEMQEGDKSLLLVLKDDEID